jgi:hypothetical protein
MSTRNTLLLITAAALAANALAAPAASAKPVPFPNSGTTYKPIDPPKPVGPISIYKPVQPLKPIGGGSTYKPVDPPKPIGPISIYKSAQTDQRRPDLQAGRSPVTTQR